MAVDCADGILPGDDRPGCLCSHAEDVGPRPEVRRTPRGAQAAPDIHSPNFNLLFFGNFGMLDYDEFARAMEEVINDPAKVYEAQVREVYTLGVYLARNKYRFIRWAYLTFILGLFVSGIVLALTDALLLAG